MDNGNLPSGKTWDDLYAHIISEHEASDKKKVTLLLDLWLLLFSQKYNDVGENVLCSLAIHDGDDNEDELGGRLDARKKAKTSKDEDRSIAAMHKNSAFAEQGLTIDRKINMVELAQLEEQKWRDDLNGTLDQLHKKTDIIIN